jgi:hypothetical protein
MRHPTLAARRRRPAAGSLLAIAAAVVTMAILDGWRSAAHGDIAPGDVITAANVAAVKDLVSPGLEWCISRGWPITIVEPTPTPWLAAYREATERYSGQVRLGADGLSLENYVAGLPFPELDPADPQVAIKIMWNYEYNLLTDDLDIRNFDADTGSISSHGGMAVERHFLLDHLRRLFWNGRLFVEPKPAMPNPNGYRRQEGLYPILEPFDLKGVGALGYRYIDPARHDDSWLYLPAMRRVRRLSTAQRSDALFGQDTDVDSYGGYAGHIAWMEWKFLGEREIIAAMHTRHFPVKWHDTVAWAFDDVWEKRQVYVVEGVSKLPQYAYSKRILYIDKQSWLIPFSDIYDHAGELWKIWINAISFRKKALEGSDVIEYPDAMAFFPAIVMVDMQLEHATRAALPSHRFKGEQGWYFNQGERYGVEEGWFTVAALVAAGH